MLPILALLALSNIKLQGSTDALEVVTTSTSAIDYEVTWTNGTATAQTTPGVESGQIVTATTTTVVAAPAASNWRVLLNVSLYNAGAASNTVTIQVDRSASNRILCKATLSAGDRLALDNQGLCHVYNSAGVERISSDIPGFNGMSLRWSKVTTAFDAIGYHYLANKDTGFPGAMSVGTPGVNGVNGVCDVVGTAGTGGALSFGTHILPDPTSGCVYLTLFGIYAVVSNTYQLVDLLWYNTGLVVTTTTAQAITTPAFPARDLNGSANGEGLGIALYALTALGNVAVNNTATVSYTNSAGTAGRTATWSASVGFQAPATAVIGTWMPFNLQAGDTGVRAIASITLATSFVSGTMMLVVYRVLAQDGVAAANFPSGSLVSRAQLNPGVRVWNDTCFGIAVIGGIATTAPSFTAGIVELMER